MNNLYAVELKVTGTYSTYIQAESKEAAEDIVKGRAREMNPDSVVFESTAYQMERCEFCGEEHFGPACRIKPVKELIPPSWERARL